jgi:hypothetical protein
MLPDDRVDAIGSYWGNPKNRAFAELLIDCEEDRTLRALERQLWTPVEGLRLAHRHTDD